MKQVTDTLGLARSNIAERVKGARPKRGPQTRDGDLEMTAAIRRLVDARPTYGYRRIAALLKRERRSDGLAPVNAKRVYRLMKRHGLLLARHTGRRRPRDHDGQVATALKYPLVLGWPGVHLLERRGRAPRLRPRLPRPRDHQLGRHDGRRLR